MSKMQKTDLIFFSYFSWLDFSFFLKKNKSFDNIKKKNKKKLYKININMIQIQAYLISKKANKTKTSTPLCATETDRSALHKVESIGFFLTALMKEHIQ